MLGTITMSDIEHLLLRDIAILGLDETISPLGKHRCVAGHGPVFVDDLIDLRPIDQVVVERITRQGRELEFERKAIVGIRQRRCIPLQCIALAGNQERDSNICIVLAELNGTAAVIEHSALVLTETIESLGCIRRKAVGNLESLLSIYLPWFISARYRFTFAEQLISMGAGVGQITPRERERDFQRTRGQCAFVTGLGKLKRRTRTRLAAIEHPRLVVNDFSKGLRAGRNMDDGFSTHFDVKSFAADGCCHAIVCASDGDRRLWRNGGPRDLSHRWGRNRAPCREQKHDHCPRADAGRQGNISRHSFEPWPSGLPRTESWVIFSPVPYGTGPRSGCENKSSVSLTTMI